MDSNFELKTIEISKVEVNKGQIEGLQRNPRQIKGYRFEALKKSITDAPEMLNLREIIVFPYKDKFIIIGGNMRYLACKELGYKELPCKVLPLDTPLRKLREYTIKDNNEFGEYDMELLSSWDKMELEDFCLDVSFDDMNMPDIQILDKMDDSAISNEHFFAKISFDTAKELNKFLHEYKETISEKFKCNISVTNK